MSVRQRRPARPGRPHGRRGVGAHRPRSTPGSGTAAVWPFPADDERRLWFYTPTDHGGLTLADMAPPQQRLAMQLVASGLSRGRLRHRLDDHGARERPRRARGVDRQFPGRTAGRDPRCTTSACSAIRRRARGRGDSAATTSRSATWSSAGGALAHAVLLRLGPGRGAAPRPASAASARRRRGPRPRARPFARRRPAGAGLLASGRTDRHRRGQPAAAVGRRPTDPADGHLARGSTTRSRLGCRPRNAEPRTRSGCGPST